MIDQESEALAQNMALKALVLRQHWLECLEYHGPLTPDGMERYEITRWASSEQLRDEAVRRWKVSRVEADIVAGAAILNLDGFLRRIADLTASDEPAKGRPEVAEGERHE